MNIKDLMTDSVSKVAEFEVACDDMINSRYILAESKIIKIMQTVALSTVLQRIISGALKGFNYIETASSWYEGGIKMPESEKDQVALTFCILADIDNGKIYLNDFLRKFFWDGDINSAYETFNATLIEPFKNFVVGALSQAQEQYEEDQPITRLERKAPQEESINRFERSPQYTAPSTQYESAATQQGEAVQFENPQMEVNEIEGLERKAMNLADVIERYKGFSQNEKDEYIFMCDTIANKARGDISSARALAIGLKRLVGEIPEIMPYMAELTEELGC
ncbi:MAG: hypothetical protein J1F36_04375 [Clostridiales bacterium]|nr:hypothetical protein [Clostridiales bacterium]